MCESKRDKGDKQYMFSPRTLREMFFNVDQQWALIFWNEPKQMARTASSYHQNF
jgi:hypothetical protein